MGGEFSDFRVFSEADGSLLYNLGFSSSGSGAGDVNGDGFDDLIVTTGSGLAVLVVWGVDGTFLHVFDEVIDYLGFAPNFLNVNGDVNGDGFDDVIVGVDGRALVYSGVDGNLLHNLVVVALDTGRFRRSVSGAGDVNGDGFDDVIVGARFGGSAHVFSGVDGSLLYFFNGDSFNPSDLLGWSVSGAGDVNGDGFDDLIVGSVCRIVVSMNQSVVLGCSPELTAAFFTTSRVMI